MAGSAPPAPSATRVASLRPMAEESRFEALGFAFSVACEDPAIGARIDHVLGPLAADGPAEHAYVLCRSDPVDRELAHEMCFDGERVSGAATGWAMVDMLVHDLNRRVIGSSPHLLLHAGGVAAGGRAVALPGHMEAGKTTLTAGLVRAGLGYLTDEALAIDRETLLVHPYPKPLSIDPGAWAFFPELAPPPAPEDDPFEYGQWQVPATEIRPEALAGPCPVVAVAFPRYEDGAETVLAPLSRGEALVELARNTFRFKERGAPELDLLAELARGVDCFRLTTGGLEAAVDLVAELLGVVPVREPAR